MQPQKIKEIGRSPEDFMCPKAKKISCAQKPKGFHAPSPHKQAVAQRQGLDGKARCNARLLASHPNSNPNRLQGSGAEYLVCLGRYPLKGQGAPLAVLGSASYVTVIVVLFVYML